MTKVSCNLQNSCDVPKVPQMLTKSLNNWSHAWAGFTHSIFKCCFFIDSHKTSVLFLEMEWQILSFNHVCFKEIHVHSNYPPIWFSMCVEEGLGLTVGFQINLHYFPIHRPRKHPNMWRLHACSQGFWYFVQKKAKFRGIFRGKFAEKSADFAGFSQKNRLISEDFRGRKVKICSKISWFRGILAEKSQITKDFQRQIPRKIGRFHGKFRGETLPKNNQ